MTRDQFSILLKKYIDQQLSEEELTIFFREVARPENEAVIQAALDNDFRANGVSGLSTADQRARAYEAFKRETGTENNTPVRRVLMYRWAAAAAIALLIVTGVQVWRTSHRPVKVVAIETKNDLPPGGNKAVLTLANGRKIILDSAANGTLAQQGNTRIIKLDNGQLAYNAGGQTGTGDINTLATPRGGRYQLNLPDGSKVWLNAASSLSYPVAFTGKDRTVTLTGEAYFEVAGNAAQPFYIKMPPSQPGRTEVKVEVLGTHFNISAYNDEASINTTLLEGAVKVSSGNYLQVLKPGQQAQVSTAGVIQLVNNADVELAVAWKNGEFRFKRAGMASIMNQLARWYNFNVQYTSPVPAMRYSGSIGRSAKLSEVLEMLGTLTGARFELKGNILKVSF